LPIIDASRLNIVAQTAKRPPNGRQSAGQTSAKRRRIMSAPKLIDGDCMRLRDGVSLPTRPAAAVVCCRIFRQRSVVCRRSFIAKRRYRRYRRL